IEHAYHPQWLLATAQIVLIVLIQGVDHAWPQLVLLAVGYRFNFTVAFNAPHRLQMILVVDVRLSARTNNGFVKRKAHAVFLEHDTATDAGVRAPLVTGSDLIFDVFDQHQRAAPIFSILA